MAVIEVPDWYRTVALVGIDDSGDPHVVLLDSAGNLVAVMKGDDSGTLRTVKVDGTGQMYTLIKGSGGEDVAVDASGNLAALMKGIDGVTLRTVAVDGSGNIVAVIKGDYGGALRTLSTDDAGHLQVVPFDPDDIWGEAIAMGNAELAAVMSAAKRYDRRGNVVDYEDFNRGLQRITPQWSGLGYSIEHSAVSARSGTYSVALTAGSNVNRYAGFYGFTPTYTDAKVGFEISFTVNPHTEYIRLMVTAYDGTNYQDFWMRYDHLTSKVQYCDSLGAWQDLETGVKLYVDPKLFNTMKLVIDTDAWEFYRWSLNLHSGDFTGQGPQTGANANNPHYRWHVRNYGSAGNNPVVYVDDMVVTVNEPT